MKKNSLLVFLLLLVGQISAQPNATSSDYSDALPEETRLAITKSALQKLKDKSTTLIVRLPSNNKKMMELERLAQSKTLDPQKVKRMQEVLVTSRAMTPAFNTRLMTSFYENYDFSEVLFIHDTASISLKNGATSGIFLNKRVQLDHNIQLKTTEYIVLHIDYDGFPEAMNINDFDALDMQLKKLPNPFPQDARSGVLLNLSLLFNKDAGMKQFLVMNKMTAKFNKKLNKAYDKYL
ncbi:MAG: hypothetical protein ACI85O_001121 [Saprospiraceae bacterium]|jgi:hypothetical protein